MKLIAGLGNVGEKYKKTRHNVGFMVVDAIAEETGADFKEKKKLHSLVAQATINGEKVLLVKPTTMMNDSGRAVRAVMDFYRLHPDDLIIVYDDLDIMFGNIKVKCGGRVGSHNGLISIQQNLGGEHWRVKIGIDQQKREIPVPADFVLANFNSEESKNLPSVLKSARTEIDKLVN